MGFEINVENLSNDTHRLTLLRDAESGVLVYIIPGNPGIIHCYKTMLQKIANDSVVDGIVASHPGHCETSQNLYGLNDACSWHSLHLMKIVDGSIQSRIYKQIYIIGHSIGCYMSLSVFDSLRPDIQMRVKGIIMCAPVIAKFSPRSSIPCWIMSRSLISPIIVGIIRSSFGQKMFPSEYLRKILTAARFPENIISLVKSELKTMTSDPLEAIVQFAGDRIAVICPEHDKYVTPKSRRRLLKAIIDSNSENGLITASPSSSADTASQNRFNSPNRKIFSSRINDSDENENLFVRKRLGVNLEMPVRISRANVRIRCMLVEKQNWLARLWHSALCFVSGGVYGDSKKLNQDEMMAINSGRVAVVEGMPHAFVLDEKANEAVAEMIVNFIDEGSLILNLDDGNKR